MMPHERLLQQRGYDSSWPSGAGGQGSQGQAGLRGGAQTHGTTGSKILLVQSVQQKEVPYPETRKNPERNRFGAGQSEGKKRGKEKSKSSA